MSDNMAENEEMAAEAAQETVAETPDFLSNPQAFMETVANSLNKGLMDLANAIPDIIAALVLVVFGWIIGSIVGGIVRKLLEFVKFEPFLKSHKIEDALGKVEVSGVLVQLTKYYVILWFVSAAVDRLTLGPLTDFLTRIVDFAPNVIGAILIAVVAAMVGELVREKVLEVHRKETYMRMLANGSKYLFIFFGIVMALETLRFPTGILTSTFVVVIQAMAFGVALAFGLAFGFGGQDTAKQWVGEWKKRLHL